MVLAIIGLLVGLAVSNVGKIFGGSQADIARIFVTTSMQTPLYTYRIDLGEYPSTADGLNALAVSKGERWRGPYVADGKLPLDPWNEPYQYRYPGLHNKSGYDLWSKGPDKLDGTADDIGNWTTTNESAK